MLKKTITYVNPMTDQEVTEDHYFHLSKADLVEMEVSKPGGMQAYITEVVKSDDNAQILSVFRDIVRRSYGRKDGDRFVRDPQTTEQFMVSEAWSEFLMSLLQDANAAAEFINGVMPRGLDQLAAAQDPANAIPGTTNAIPGTTDPTGLTNQVAPRVLTPAEVAAMDSDELKSGLATGRYKLS